MLVGDCQQLPAEPQEILAGARRDQTGSVVTKTPAVPNLGMRFHVTRPADLRVLAVSPL